MDVYKPCSILCSVLGESKLKIESNGEKLDDFFGLELTASKKAKQTSEEQKRRKEVGKIKEKVKDFYLPGQGRTLSTLADMTQDLLKRDYIKLYDVNSKEPCKGSTFVPDCKLPNVAIVKPSKADKGKKNVLTKEDEKELFKRCKSKKDKELLSTLLRKFSGDSTEWLVYHHLRDLLETEFKDELFLVVHGLKMRQFDRSKRAEQDNQEFDFVIINYSRRSIFTIEVKTTIGTQETFDAGQSGKTRIEKARDQLFNYKQFFESWFGRDISDSWRFFSATFCSVKEQGLDFCKDCNDFIAMTKNDLKKVLSFPEKNLEEDESLLEEFKLMSRYLLFCSSVRKLPTRGNLPKAIREIIKESGKIENIKLWYTLTPKQSMILQEPRFIFLSCWGSGKTLLMLEKAKELNDNGEKVLFLIFVDVNQGRQSLLFHDLKARLEGCKNVTLQAIYSTDLENLANILQGFDHVLMDEFYEEMFSILKNANPLQKALEKKKTGWIAISNSIKAFDTSIDQCGKLGDRKKEVENVAAATKKFFGNNFNTASFNTPLRQGKSVHEEVTKLVETDTSPNAILMSQAILPLNIVEGLGIKAIQGQSIFQSLNICFELIGQTSGALIIVDEEPMRNMLETVQGLLPEKDPCLLHLQVLKETLVMLGRPSPVFLTNHDEFCSSDSLISDWICGSRMNNGSKRREPWDVDLVTTANFVKGFEREILIDMTTKPTATSYSRASMQVLRIDTDAWISKDLWSQYEEVLQSEIKGSRLCHNLRDLLDCLGLQEDEELNGSVSHYGDGIFMKIAKIANHFSKKIKVQDFQGTFSITLSPFQVSDTEEVISIRLFYYPESQDFIIAESFNEDEIEISKSMEFAPCKRIAKELSPDFHCIFKKKLKTEVHFLPASLAQAAIESIIVDKKVAFIHESPSPELAKYLPSLVFSGNNRKEPLLAMTRSDVLKWQKSGKEDKQDILTSSDCIEDIPIDYIIDLSTNNDSNETIGKSYKIMWTTWPHLEQDELDLADLLSE